MKYRLHIIILIFLIPFEALCQDLKIKVVSEGDVLPYANVFVNNKWTGHADSLGIFNIKNGELAAADTITVSYIGAKETSVVYNGSDKTIVVKMAAITEIGAVTVAALKDPVKFFKNDVKFPNLSSDYSLFDMDIDIISTLPGINSYSDANVSLIYNYANNYKDEKFKYLDCSFSEDNLTVLSVAQALKNVITCVPQNYGIKVLRGYDIRYLGEKDNCYLFSVIFKKHDFAHYIYSVDIDTKTIKHIESLYVNESTGVFREISVNMSSVEKNKYHMTDFKYSIKKETYDLSIVGKNVTSTNFQKEYYNMYKEEDWMPLYPLAK